MPNLIPFPKFRALDGHGLPLVGGKLHSYSAGTTNPKATYAAADGTPNTNPVILDGNGECVVFVGTGAYKFVLTDADDVEQWSVDGVENGWLLLNPDADQTITDHVLNVPDGINAPLGQQTPAAAKVTTLDASGAAALKAVSMTALTVGTGVAQGGGMKHKRVAIISVPANDWVECVVTWDTPFADANYTVVATAEDVSLWGYLQAHTIKAKTAAAVAFSVFNSSLTTAYTGTLHAIAMHD